ncbi:MAG TPA: MFS transporter, partial [Pseudolabrys sp.]|nr:MFS transporter [Pseudolabrys sp.]
MAQTIEGFVGKALDEAKLSPLHIKVIALIAAGYFFDVIDLIVLGSLIPDMIQSKFATGAEAAWIGSATVFGMFLGGIGQGEFSDRFGRKTVYQFNLLIFGVFTILGALAPSVWLLVLCRFIAGLGLGGEQPLAFAYAGEYSPARIRGRILAFVHFVGGACVWPIATLFTLAFRDDIGWRGVWVVIGVGSLIVWGLRFALPESPRFLATHGKGKEALDVLARMNIAGPTEPLATDAASDTKSDPFSIVFRMFPTRVIAGMICFSAFFGVAIGLGGWLPNIMHDKGFSITKSLEFVLGMNFAVPCASLFMMYALDKYGRKITSV